MEFSRKTFSANALLSIKRAAHKLFQKKANTKNSLLKQQKNV